MNYGAFYRKDPLILEVLAPLRVLRSGSAHVEEIRLRLVLGNVVPQDFAEELLKLRVIFVTMK